MRLTLLGTGTPILDANRCGSSALVEIGETRIVVDAGRGTVPQLLAAGAHPSSIDVVLLTHHHHDHISSLGELLLTAWHNGRSAPIPVYGPPGTEAIVSALFTHVFARDIAFARFTEPDAADIRDVVRARDVQSGAVLDGDGWRVVIAEVDHGHGLGLSREEWPCLGYRIEEGAHVLAFSGDAVECPGLDRLAHDADLLVQCCYLAEAEIETPFYRSMAEHVIASSRQAGEIARRNRVKRLVLTHIRPKSRELMESLVRDVRRSYAGEIVLADDLSVFDV